MLALVLSSLELLVRKLAGYLWTEILEEHADTVWNVASHSTHTPSTMHMLREMKDIAAIFVIKKQTM